MKAIWNNKIIAEADKDELIYIEGNWYFPPESVNKEYLRESPTPYTCPWKGVCQYFDVFEDDKVTKDSAFSYPEPLPGAIDIVKKDFSNYVAFWRDIKVTEQVEQAIFAAGCFWGVQYYFDQVPGVVESVVGYIGGNTNNPSYEDVCYKQTGHAEAVKLTYNPNVITYETLLKQFFRMHDPTQLNRQGPDIGDQYRSAIFITNNEQKQQAVDFIESLKKEKPIVTTIEQADNFWVAEDYHQKYSEKTGRGMCHVDYKQV